MSMPIILIAALAVPVEGPPPTKPLVESPALLYASLAQEDEPAAEDEGPKWTGAFALGATITDGNTEVISASSTFDTQRESDQDRHTISAFWNFQEDRAAGDVLQRKIGANYKYDYFVTEKMYYLGAITAEQDEQAMVDLRWSIGAGVGYQWRNEPKFSFNTEAGLSYFSEEFADGSDNDYLAVRLAYDLGYDISETTRFEQTMFVLPSVEDIDDVYGKLDSRIKFDITETMFAQIQWVFDYDNTPAPGAEPRDHLVQIGVGWSW